jgi:hypothetical protein
MAGAVVVRTTSMKVELASFEQMENICRAVDIQETQFMATPKKSQKVHAFHT